MTQQQVQESVLAFLRSEILYDQNRVIGEDESFLQSGILDSTGILELIAFLEGKYGVKFLDTDLVADNFDSLKRVSKFMVDKISNPQSA
jgi:acyl carrier protein